MRKVETKAVITVRIKLPIFSAGMFLKNLIDIIISFDTFYKCLRILG